MNTDVVFSTVELLKQQQLLQELRKTDTLNGAVVTLLVADSLQCELDSDFSDENVTVFSKLVDSLTSEKDFENRRSEVAEVCSKAVDLVESNLDKLQLCIRIFSKAVAFTSKH